jgi:hypothetical protein
MIQIKKIIFLCILISLAGFAKTETWYTKSYRSQGFFLGRLAFGKVDDTTKYLIKPSIAAFVGVDTAALRIAQRIQKFCIENHLPLRKDIAEASRYNETYFTFSPDSKEAQSRYFHIMAPDLYPVVDSLGRLTSTDTPLTLFNLIYPYNAYDKESERQKLLAFHTRSHCVGIMVLNLRGFARDTLIGNLTESEILALKDSQYRIYVYDDMPDHESPLTAECRANFHELQRLLGSRQIQLISGDENACAERILKENLPRLDKAEIKEGIKKHGAVGYLNKRAIHGPSIPAHASRMPAARRCSTRAPMAGAGAGRSLAPRSQSPRSRARIAATTELDSLFPPTPDWQSPFEVETLAEKGQREADEQRQAMRDARIRLFATK